MPKGKGVGWTLSPTGKYSIFTERNQALLMAEDRQSGVRLSYHVAEDIIYYKKIIRTNLSYCDGGFEIDTRVFLPPLYENQATLFYIPGTASLNLYRESIKAFCSHLCKQFNCRVVAIFHRVAPEAQFPRPNNDIYHAINCYLEFIDPLKHRLFLGGYSSGGLAALLTCMEAMHCNIPFEWLLLIAPAVNLSSLAHQRQYGIDTVVTDQFYNHFLKAYLGEHDQEAYAAILSPERQAAFEFHRFPPTTIVVGDQDALYVEIHLFYARFFSMSSQHHLKIIPGFDHCLPWKNKDFIQKIKVSNATNLVRIQATRFIYFNEILHAAPARELNRVFSFYRGKTCEWFDHPDAINKYENTIHDVMRACVQTVSYLQYFSKIFLSNKQDEEKLQITDVLRISNALSMYYLCIQRDTKIAEQSLKVTERTLEYSGELCSADEETQSAGTIEKVYVLNHRALQSFFDNQAKSLKDYSKSAYDLIDQYKLSALSVFGGVLTFRGHAAYLYRDFKEATYWYKQALSAKERYYGHEHVDAAGSIEDLGNVLREQGDYTGAFQLHEKSLKIKEAYYHADLGNALPNLAHSNRALADLLLLQYRFSEAMKYNEKALCFFNTVEEMAITKMFIGITNNLLSSQAPVRLDKGEVTFFKNHPAYRSSKKIREFVLAYEEFSEREKFGLQSKL